MPPKRQTISVNLHWPGNGDKLSAVGKPVVVIGILGTTLDRGQGRSRWKRWRPTVDLVRHADLAPARMELLHTEPHAALAKTVGEDIGLLAPDTEVCPQQVTFDDPWDFEEVYGRLHDFARSYPFDPAREDYLVHMTTGTHVAQICLFLLTEARYLPARLLQTSPANKGDPLPGTYRIIDLDLSRYERLASRFLSEQDEGVSLLKAGIETKNEVFNALIGRIEHVVLRSRAPVLLTGPTGAGKTALARRIFELKQQRRQVDGRFVELNCATIRGDQAMSMLFGHTKGAFTGAAKARKGLLKEADGGIVFLDEIGELGGDEQAMLLRALEDKRFVPLGSDREVASDFQLIAGTNRDLHRSVQDGSFREDLLARIDLWTFELPGLAARPEDIAPNLDYELERYSAQQGTRVTFNKDARARFEQFARSTEATWRRNFRDFSAAVERMATLAPGARITDALVAEEQARLLRTWTDAAEPDLDAAVVDEVLGEGAAADLDRFDLVQLAEVVRVCRQARSLSEAGRLLFAASRRERKSVNDADRLRKYLARFELSWASIVS